MGGENTEYGADQIQILEGLYYYVYLSEVAGVFCRPVDAINLK